MVRQATARRAIAAGAFTAAVAVASAALAAIAAPASAQTARPSAAALIAGAKKTLLDKFEVRDELRGLTVETWLKQMFGARPIAWRASSCRESANGHAMIASPICVLAVVRYPAGVAFELGIGFDAKAARPQDHPNAMWGRVIIRGRHCDFLRHPDRMHEMQLALEEMVKAGGQCQ